MGRQSDRMGPHGDATGVTRAEPLAHLVLLRCDPGCWSFIVEMGGDRHAAPSEKVACACCSLVQLGSCRGLVAFHIFRVSTKWLKVPCCLALT